MSSPFLIVRFIFFSVLVYLNFLNLVFASWNIHAVKSIGLSVPGASVILILNSIASFLFIAIGLAGMIWENFSACHVVFECAWSALLSLSQIGTTIAFTVTGSVLIRTTDDWGVSVSSILLLPTSWLTSLSMLAYFFVLLVSAITHLRLDADLWSKSVYVVKWFGYTNAKVKTSDIGAPRPKTGFENDSWARYLEDIESSAARKARYPLPSGEKAPWAPDNIRRGRDPPFRAAGKRDDESSSGFSRTSTPRSSGPLPPLPLRVEVKGGRPGQSAGSRFIERFRESQTISRPARPSRPAFDFPHEVEDHDKPIPLPRLSQWIRADAIKGFLSH